VSLALRAALFFGLWLVLAGPEGLLVGALAAAAAGWVSLRLMPPRGVPWRLVTAVRLARSVVQETVAGGIDVARRAFDPRLPLSPGLVRHTMALPPGLAQDGFRALASLQPGALPSGCDADGSLVVHALDTGLPIAAGMARAEAMFAEAVGGRAPHG
jgi:multicomponent Na+:H+ antiporter subunit E